MRLKAYFFPLITSGGTDKLPEDFKTQHKFVDPEEEAAARAEKKKGQEAKARDHQTMLRLATMRLQGKDTETPNLGEWCAYVVFDVWCRVLFTQIAESFKW